MFRSNTIRNTHHRPQEGRLPVRAWLSVVAGAFLALAHMPASGAETDPRLAGSRAAISSFGAELKAALSEGMAKGGPPAAIAVCQEAAPAIAAAQSAELGAQVGRTSRRFRNPVNAPSPAEQVALEAFEDRLRSGESAANMEHWRVGADGSAIYLRPIVIAPVCLACHGEVLAPETKAAIDRLYADDRATGYREGQLRGAFRVVWPAR